METMDYINPADGLLYCGKCQTPKQCRVKFLGHETVQYCLCKCRQERLAAEKAERERQQAVADKRRRESICHTKKQNVDLLLELDDGRTGHIKGKISLKE